MRAYTRAATAVVTLGLAVSMAACSSSGSSKTNTQQQPTSPATTSPATTSAAPAPGGASTPASQAGGSDAGTNPQAKPVGAFKTLTGNFTAVALDPGFVKAITALGLTPAPTGTAKFNAKTGTIAFPITGGNATIYKKGDVTPYVQGKIVHDGSGLSLSAGGTTVTLENFVIDPGNNSQLTGKVLLNGKVFAPSVKLFDLDGSTLQPPTISSAGVATLTGTTVYLSPEAAGALNKAFKLAGTPKALPTKKDAIKVGIATIKATGK